MNYMTEIKLFYDWLETHPLSPASITLWHALMFIANRSGWREELRIFCGATGDADEYAAHNDIPPAGDSQSRRAYHLRLAGRPSSLHLPDYPLGVPLCVPPRNTKRDTNYCANSRCAAGCAPQRHTI